MLKDGWCPNFNVPQARSERGTRGTSPLQGLRLVSLWDIMEQRFSCCAAIISQNQILLSSIVSALNGMSARDVVSKDFVASTKPWIENLIGHLNELDLTMARSKAVTLTHSLHDSANAIEVWSRARDLMETLREELYSIRFLPVPPSRDKYTQPDPFGPLVAAKFRSAEYDIAEAGMCFACGRWTATVMHCMRVLEFGLDALGDALKVKRGSRGWGQDLNNFSTKWDQTVKSWTKGKPSLAWRRQLFPKLFNEFRHFEFAWRNHAVHAHASYGEMEAGRVFEHVRTFMELISERLRESKKKRLKT